MQLVEIVLTPALSGSLAPFPPGILARLSARLACAAVPCRRRPAPASSALGMGPGGLSDPDARFDERSGHPRTRCNTVTSFDLAVGARRPNSISGQLPKPLPTPRASRAISRYYTLIWLGVRGGKVAQAVGPRVGRLWSTRRQ